MNARPVQSVSDADPARSQLIVIDHAEPIASGCRDLDVTLQLPHPPRRSMTASFLVSRRSMLATGGMTALGATVILAGCGGSSSKSAADTVTTPAGSTPADTTAPTSSAATSSAATSSAPASSPAASGTAVAKLSDVPVGGSASAKLDGKPILLSQPTAGTVVGFSAICTHQGCTVNPSGKTLNCPCHGSQFDAFTGAVIQGPAPSPLNKITVTVSGTSVLASGSS
jgi:cytochrome b6-f complex iron-sulfur subunit